MTDEQIVALFWTRSEEAIRQTDATYGRRLYVLADRILQSPVLRCTYSSSFLFPVAAPSCPLYPLLLRKATGAFCPMTTAMVLSNSLSLSGKIEFIISHDERGESDAQKRRKDCHILP